MLTITKNFQIVTQYMSINGRIGPEVRSVVVRPANAEDVIATVNHEWFAAW